MTRVLFKTNKNNKMSKEELFNFLTKNKNLTQEAKNFPDVVDKLAWQAVFGDPKDQKEVRWLIWESALALGIIPSSIHNLYMARGEEKIPSSFTVPALNLRGMTYDTAQEVFKTAKKLHCGAFVLELARSEMGYTNQSPEEYVTVCLAAALKEGWEGPVFFQGDHFQTKLDEAKGGPKSGEVEFIKKLISESLNAGFYNIDIDSSTLVDLKKPTVEEQQAQNIYYSALFAQYIRKIEPSGITVAIGGELGHIGGKNSTAEEFKTYMAGFNASFKAKLPKMAKISIQTGTRHGGLVLPDGSLAEISIDFNLLSAISKICRKEYGMGGAVQHGASTLPDSFFGKFVKAEALEVHLATEFQNIIMDHPSFPEGLLKKIYGWLNENKKTNASRNQTPKQFHYQTRKYAWGQFKKECWSIKKPAKKEIMDAFQQKLEFLFKALNVADTKEMINNFISPVTIHKKIEDFSKPSVTKNLKHSG